MIKKLLLFILLISTLTSLNAQNEIIYVDAAATGMGDGSSWQSAYPHLSDALNFANANMNVSEIRIAKGTYYPTGAQGGTDRYATFVITRGGLHLQGGYPTGGGGAPQGYDQDQGTILSGNIGDKESSEDNSLHILTIVNVSSSDTLTISGLQISDGYAEINQRRQINGGWVLDLDASGVYIDNPTLPIEFTECVFTRNYASSYGAGIYLKSSTDLLITNCLFYKNLNAHGAAISCDFGNVTITNTTIADHDEIAIWPGFDCNLTIYNSILWGNKENIPPLLLNEEYSPTVFIDYSIVESYFLLDYDIIGINVYDDDPMFVDPDNNNYHLKSGSPAINKAHPEFLLPTQQTDFSSNPRTVNWGPDLGAYEHQIFNNTITNNQSSSYNGMTGNIEISGSELTSGVQPVTYEWAIQILGNTDTKMIDTLLSINPTSISPIKLLALDNYGIHLVANLFKVSDLSKLPELLSIMSNSTLPDDILSFQGEMKFSRLATAGGSPDISNQISIEFLAEATPVKIIDFSGKLENEQAVLSWHTGLEEGLSHFEIERRSNNTDDAGSASWQRVASISAKGKDSHYKLSIPQKAAHGNMYYRLKAVDLDGSANYHDKVIHLGKGIAATVKVYPNPASDRIFINLNKPATSTLFDQLGRQVMQATSLKPGLNTLNITGLSAGRYYGKLSTGEHFSFIKK